MVKATLVAAAVLALAGCGARENQLQYFRSATVAPQERAVQTGQPLVIPQTNALPEPVR